MASIAGLVPKFKEQSDYEWDKIKPVLRNPKNYTFEDIVNKLEDISSGSFLSFLWDDDERDIRRRQRIWILCLLLFREGWDNSENRQRVLDLVQEWDIDESVFLDMKDTAETYRVLSQAHIDDWDMKRKEEFKRNKNDLDKSIRNLIELG